MFVQVKLAWKWKTYFGCCGKEDIDAYYLLLIIAVFKTGSDYVYGNGALFFRLCWLKWVTSDDLASVKDFFFFISESA